MRITMRTILTTILTGFTMASPAIAAYLMGVFS